MGKRKFDIIENKNEVSCGRCKGTGRVNETNLMVPDCEICCRCNGTGQYIDTSYILIAGKIAFDMDTIK